MKTRVVCLTLALILLIAPASIAETYAPVAPDAAQSYAMNLFISNFTEVGARSLAFNSPDMDLVDFAHDHMWFNNQEKYEFGEYFSDNNCRVSDDDIQSILNKYFFEAPAVDLSETRLDYDGEYYYHCETGGWTSCGFAVNNSVARVGEDTWFISFVIFAGGDNWVKDDLKLSVEGAMQKFGAPSGYGCALVRATDIADRATYQMISYAAF